MKDWKQNPSFCILITACSLFSCRTLRGVTFLRRKVTKSRRAAARNPLEPGRGAFPSLCKTETRCVPSSAKHFVTHGAPARPPSDRSLAKSGNSCVFISCTNAASDYLEYQKEDRQNWHSFRAGTKRCRLESDLTPYCQWFPRKVYTVLFASCYYRLCIFISGSVLFLKGWSAQSFALSRKMI